eukprot:gene3176-8218_t
MAAMRGGSSSFRSSLLLRCWGDVRQLAAANRKYLSMHQQKGDENQLVQYSVADSVATITLNDPKHLNALTENMGDQLSEIVEELRQRKDIRVAILTGAGEAFSAGGDLKFLQARIDTRSQLKNQNVMLNFYSRFLSVRKLQVPVIAAINGPAVGAGLCLAVACDLRIAHVSSKMGFTFSRLGLHPGMAATHFAPKVLGPQLATQMLLTGEVIDGATALRRGLVVDIANSKDGVLRKAHTLASDIAASSPLAVRQCILSLRKMVQKAQCSVRKIEETGLSDALAQEALSQSICYSAPDLQEGIEAVIEKRSPQFTT